MIIFLCHVVETLGYLTGAYAVIGWLFELGPWSR